jgi:hypothetical protein
MPMQAQWGYGPVRNLSARKWRVISTKSRPLYPREGDQEAVLARVTLTSLSSLTVRLDVSDREMRDVQYSLKAAERKLDVNNVQKESFIKC